MHPSADFPVYEFERPYRHRSRRLVHECSDSPALLMLQRAQQRYLPKRLRHGSSTEPQGGICRQKADKGAFPPSCL